MRHVLQKHSFKIFVQNIRVWHRLHHIICKWYRIKFYSLCHTKKRIGGQGPTNPSFNMTPTIKYNLWRVQIILEWLYQRSFFCSTYLITCNLPVCKRLPCKREINRLLDSRVYNLILSKKNFNYPSTDHHSELCSFWLALMSLCVCVGGGSHLRIWVTFHTKVPIAKACPRWAHDNVTLLHLIYKLQN